LFGNADIDDAVGVGVGERGQADRVQHRRGDGDDVGPHGRQLDDLVREGAGPAGRLWQLDSGQRIECTRAVEVVELVVFGRPVAEALAGAAMHYYRTAEP